MVANARFLLSSRGRSEAQPEKKAPTGPESSLGIIWLNDGVDGNDTVSGDVGQADLTVQADLNPLTGKPNCLQSPAHVTCTRDLENFARLWLSIGGLSQAITSGNITVGLEWHSNTGDAVNGWGPNDGTPAINIYAAAPPHGSSVVTGGADYLTDPSTASDQASAPYSVALGTVTKGSPFYFPATALYSLTATNPNAYFIFEGAGWGTGRLVITFNTGTAGNYTKIGESGGLFMNLTDIKGLYERWTVGDGPTLNPSAPSFAPYSGGGLPLSQAQISTARLSAGLTQGFQYSSSTPGLSVPTDPNGNKYILFVHGYNMQPWEKDTFAATALKRLYWQGYKGKFGTFQWPATYHTSSVAAPFDYDMSEYTAWWSSYPLGRLLQQLNGTSSGVYVLAHSMGNVVTGEALRQAAQISQVLIAGYVPSQAAVPVQVYDITQPTPSGFFATVGPTMKTTPNIYVGWMGSNGTSATSIGNFYNANDWALNSSHWQTDERLKPDHATGLYPPYNYAGDSNAPPVAQGFSSSQDAGSGQTHWLSLATNGAINDQYEIMAFAAQAQCPALGATPTSAQGIVSTDLTSTTIWETDPYSNNFQDHVWHSAEFEFSNADQQNYWNALMKRFGLPTNQ